MTPQFASYPSLKGKSVLVTGGASGIGAQIVRAFAAQGARVGFIDMDADSSEALVADIGGGDVGFEVCDLRDIEALRGAVADLADRFGP